MRTSALFTALSKLVCSNRVGVTICQCFLSSFTFTAQRIVAVEGFNALSSVDFTGFVPMQAASFICTYVHVCEAVWVSLSRWN